MARRATHELLLVVCLHCQIWVKGVVLWRIFSCKVREREGGGRMELEERGGGSLYPSAGEGGVRHA